MKVTMALKLEMAQKYVSGNYKLMDLCKMHDVGKDKIQYYVNLYRLYGDKPFVDSEEKRVYTREEKLEAIKQVLSGKKTCQSIALEKAVPNPHVVQDWVALYKRKSEDE